MSLLSIIKNAMLRQNTAAPTSVIGNPDTGIQQRLALLQDLGDELAERVQWQALNIAGTYSGNGVQALFPFPSGFGGLSVGMKFQSTLYPMLPVTGPVTNEDLAALKAFPVMPIQSVWRPIDGSFEFWPPPPQNEVYNFNYYSTYWISSGKTPVATWAADTDVSLIDEKILTTGLEYRWLKAKGLPYDVEERRFEDRLARADGRDDDGRMVSMSRSRLGNNMTWPGAIPIAGFDGFDSGFDSGFS